MANDLRLSVIMQLADRAAAPLRNISKSSTAAARALKDARDTLKKLDQQQKTLSGLEKQRAAMRESANQVKVLQQNLDALRHTDGASRKDIEAKERALASSTAAYQKQRDSVFRLRQQLTALGVTKLGQTQTRLATDMAAANQVIDQQTAKLRALHAQQSKLDKLRTRHASDMMHMGMLGGAGAAGIATGRTLARPIGAALGAYGAQEGASSQLRGTMMLANGSVSSEFKQIEELAIRLGDHLPGTTTEFVEMMTMLRRQGLTAQTILGGTGEAAAYLGVQLRLPVIEAAEFAAKMQDATRTTERDMMSLMDTIQRTFYLGVDPENMLQGFTKMSPVMSIIKQEGLAAANTLAPLLVMLDQTGMRGESAGNAIRKVFQATLDAKKLDKANALMGRGQALNFIDSKGQFAGIESLVNQLGKINAITNQMQRMSVIKALFGDDAETLQTVETLMAKGMAGYREVATKMQAQADLRRRVDDQLKTWSNVVEAAQGTFTNVLASLGATVVDDAKAIVNWLGEVTAGFRAWVSENPKLVGAIVKVVAVLAALFIGVGSLLLVVAAVVAPLLALRMVLSWVGIKTGLWSIALRVLLASLRFVAGAIAFLARLLLLNPIGLTITAIATAAFLIYKYWGPIKAFFAGLWNSIVLGAQALWQAFTGLGRQIMDGLIGGITSRLAAVRDAITGVASATIGWFREKLGIQSPSRVFMAAGEHIGQGAAIGIGRSTALVRTAATGLTAAALTPLASGMAAMDQRAPLGASARSPIVVQGDTITLQIHAAPGMDAQQIAQAVRAELDRREQARLARARASLSDIH